MYCHRDSRAHLSYQILPLPTFIQHARVCNFFAQSEDPFLHSTKGIMTRLKCNEMELFTFLKVLRFKTIFLANGWIQPELFVQGSLLSAWNQLRDPSVRTLILSPKTSFCGQFRDKSQKCERGSTLKFPVPTKMFLVNQYTSVLYTNKTRVGTTVYNVGCESNATKVFFCRIISRCSTTRNRVVRRLRFVW